MTPTLDPKLLYSMVESSRDVIYLLNLVPQLRFEYINPSVEQVTGYAPRDFYDDPLLHRRILHPDDLGLLAQLRSDPARLEDPILMRWFHKDGRLALTEERVAPIRDDVNQLVGIQGVGRLLSFYPAKGEVHDAPVEDLQRFRAVPRGADNLLVVCSACKSVREDESRWCPSDEYLSRVTNKGLSHGLCTDCAYRLYRFNRSVEN